MFTALTLLASVCWMSCSKKESIKAVLFLFLLLSSNHSTRSLFSVLSSQFYSFSGHFWIIIEQHHFQILKINLKWHPTSHPILGSSLLLYGMTQEVYNLAVGKGTWPTSLLLQYPILPLLSPPALCSCRSTKVREPCGLIHELTILPKQSLLPKERSGSIFSPVLWRGGG